jgi:hypothetical protein
MNKLTNSMIGAGVATFTTVGSVLAQQEIIIVQPTGGVHNFGNLLTAGIQTALIIAAILTFVFLIWGGIQWITSGGDKAAYESARNRITAALVGLAIVAASWALMQLIGYFFNINVFEFRIPSAGGA